MSHSARALNRATLARQLLLRRERLDVVEAVRRVVALQAQEPASPYLALWNRVAGFDPADLDAAFADGSVVKATLMRITLHVVAAEDHPRFHAAMLPNLRASRLHDRRYTGTGLRAEDADAVLPDLLAFAAEARTKAEIEAFLTDHLGDPVEPRLWWALKTFAPLVHTPTDATWSFGRRPSFQAAPTEPAPGTSDTSLAHLVRRYLEGFGPATVADVAQFALQQRARVRAALRTMADELVTSTGPDGVELFDVAGGVVPDEDTSAPPRLLPMWDSILLAYADRSRLIPDELRPVVIRRNGDVLPTVLVDGHVAGVWRSVGDGIEVRVFSSSTVDWPALADEARSLRSMLGGRELDPFRRYGHWWAKLPEGEDRLLTA